jgi:hypothetical protein
MNHQSQREPELSASPETQTIGSAGRFAVILETEPGDPSLHTPELHAAQALPARSDYFRAVTAEPAPVITDSVFDEVGLESVAMQLIPPEVPSATKTSPTQSPHRGSTPASQIERRAGRTL